ncbi:MAG: hypothetical protein AAGE96_13200 [Cyanobacteria bacterium P01_G01_bin.19]
MSSILSVKSVEGLVTEYKRKNQNQNLLMTPNILIALLLVFFSSKSSTNAHLNRGTPNSELRTPNSELLTPNSELRTPNSELLTPNS